jgi:ATP-dependent helicase/nuclease subunit A
VQRCVQWLLEDRHNSLDQILMVTFTEAAAAEMRQRIRAELNSALDDQPSDPHIPEELALLQTAHISTLHSFCLQLVRQHFYELELDPQVAVLSGEEARLLAEEVLTNILKHHYTGKLANSEAVQDLIQVQGRGWDKPIRKLVLRLHEYTKTLPDSARWFRDQFAIFAEAEPRQWQSWLHEFLPVWSIQWMTDLQTFIDTPAVAKALAALRMATAPRTLSEVHGVLREILQAGDRANKALWPRGSIGKIRDQIRELEKKKRPAPAEGQGEA